MANYTSIRYGKMRTVGRFKTEREDLRVRDRCLIKTDRGKEVGEVLTPLAAIPESVAPESLWDVVRLAEPQDLQMAARVETESVPHAVRFCKDLVLKLKLPMKISDAEYLLGGERVIFYFTSETRVDFRELVRLLAQEFRTRIDLKQVGARDQARLVGDVGHCGLELCCRTHLKELGGISMDMAKIQKHTADPSKITGRCGKLLCCLRYEYSTYKDSREVLPGRGTRVQTPKGVGIIVDQNLLLRELTVQPELGDRYIVKLEEISGAPPAVAGCNGCSTGAKPEAPPATVEAPAAATTEAAPAPALPPPVAPGKFIAQPRPAGPLPPKAAQPSRRDRGPLDRRPVVDAGFWMSLGPVSELAPGASKEYELGGAKLALFNVDGVVHALSNECSHQAGPLGQGKLEGFSVSCPLHAWKFDVTTGHCLSVSGGSVRKWDTAVVKDEICVMIGGRLVAKPSPPPAPAAPVVAEAPLPPAPAPEAPLASAEAPAPPVAPEALPESPAPTPPPLV